MDPFSYLGRSYVDHPGTRSDAPGGRAWTFNADATAQTSLLGAHLVDDESFDGDGSCVVDGLPLALQ